MDLILRKYKPSDCQALAELFYDTVHAVCKDDYSEKQLYAWATGTVDLIKWNQSFLSHYTIVAEINGNIAGFGDIDSNGYLDRLYVHKDFQRRGIGSSICSILENMVDSDKIITHASITAKGFFEKRGYKVIKEQQVKRQGIKNKMKNNKNIQNSKGSFIAFEGIDGSGKSTQVKMLTEKMKEEGIYCYTTMEPTDSPIGSLIHQIMTGRIKADNKVIAALFAADRLDHLLNDINGIVSKINEGITVISDRYYFSSYAYHSVDMPMDWVIKANEQSSVILKPTVNIFIDVNPDTAIERIAKNRFHQELFEKKSRLVKVREKYLEAFVKLKESERVIIVDGNRSKQEIADDIWDKIKPYLAD